MTQVLDQYQPGYSFAHVGTASTALQISTVAGILYSVCINQKGSASSLVTLYDNTAGSGTIIGIIDPTVNVQTLFYECAVQKGIYFSSAGAAATGDFTITYK
jgi:hypothetical protein